MVTYDAQLKEEGNKRVLVTGKSYVAKCFFCSEPYNKDDLWYWCERGKVIYCRLCLEKTGDKAPCCPWASGKEHNEWRFDELKIRQEAKEDEEEGENSEQFS